MRPVPRYLRLFVVLHVSFGIACFFFRSRCVARVRCTAAVNLPATPRFSVLYPLLCCTLAATIIRILVSLPLRCTFTLRSRSSPFTTVRVVVSRVVSWTRPVRLRQPCCMYRVCFARLCRIDALYVNPRLWHSIFASGVGQRFRARKSGVIAAYTLAVAVSVVILSAAVGP